MGQTVNHTVQCVLVLNVFMEKVFLILWAWYFVLAGLTLANITTWFQHKKTRKLFIFKL